MKKITNIFVLIVGLTFGSALLGASPSYGAITNSTPITALILYDAPSPDAYQNLGKAYAIMLRNLMGHWNSTVTMVPIQNYTAGQLNNYNVTFYMGSYYDNPIPTAFLTDVTTTQNTVVWFKYNLWQLAWNSAYNFNAQYGFGFSDLQGMNAAPTLANPAPGFFDTVSYKNQSMAKYYAFDAATGTINADPDIGVTQILTPTIATSVVNITNSATQAQIPYVIHSTPTQASGSKGDFWYFADLPLSYIGPQDRYLVLCDLLHDILGDTQPTIHQALVRLEDVSANVDQATIVTLSDYLYSKKIPFSIAAIPRYIDVFGYWNDGVPVNTPMNAKTAATSLVSAPVLRASLNYAIKKGAKIVMHGWTHQNSDVGKNPHTGTSGDDYEFWNSVTNTPPPNDSTAWALARLKAGLAEMKSAGFTPFAWEAPHYQSSPLSMKAVPQVFPTTYQRVVYYTSDTPNFTLATGKDYLVGQFFPYMIQKDYYGQKVIPENLGNIEYNISQVDASSYLTYSAETLVTNAKYGLVVRDGFASFFFHPFWLDNTLVTNTGAPVKGLADFQTVITGITGLGYTWVDPSKL